MKKLLCICTIGAACFFISCKKEITPKEEVISNDGGSPSYLITLTKLDYFKLITEVFLNKAKNSVEFKKMVYSECGAEYDGDYYVRINALLALNASQNYEFFGIEEAMQLQEYLDAIESIDYANGELFTQPTVFVPFIEDLDLDSLKNHCPVNTPEAVIAMEYDTATTHCNGYNLNAASALQNFTSSIDEVYAWANDLWVFGQEENIGDSGNGQRFNNPVPSKPNPNAANRVDGRTERGAIIQVTDIKSVEYWVSGQLDFRYIVFSANGLKISDLNLPKVKRKHFKNNAWYDYNIFIANWNISNLGNFMIENWVELDGGQSSSITMNIPSSCTGCPAYSISLPSKDRDDNLGQSIVQFTDPVQPTDPTTTVYNISYSNFKRKH